MRPKLYQYNFPVVFIPVQPAVFFSCVTTVLLETRFQIFHLGHKVLIYKVVTTRTTMRGYYNSPVLSFLTMAQWCRFYTSYSHYNLIAPKKHIFLFFSLNKISLFYYYTSTQLFNYHTKKEKSLGSACFDHPDPNLPADTPF